MADGVTRTPLDHNQVHSHALSLARKNFLAAVAPQGDCRERQ